MKRFAAVVLALLLLVPFSALAKGSHKGSPKKSSSSSTNPKIVHVRGYYRKDGTYVQPHDRTAPNETRNDNWSTRGNVNPETGKPGTKPRDEDIVSPAYQPPPATHQEQTAVHPPIAPAATTATPTIYSVPRYSAAAVTPQLSIVAPQIPERVGPSGRPCTAATELWATCACAPTTFQQEQAVKGDLSKSILGEADRRGVTHISWNTFRVTDGEARLSAFAYVCR